MSDNISFYNPVDIGYFDIGTTQVNKVLPFKSVDGVFIPECYVRFKTLDKKQVAKFEIGNGLTIIGNNVQGEEKTLQLVISGSDFPTLGQGSLVKAECSFFVLGDIEITFSLEIK